MLHLLTAATLLSLGAPDTPPAEPIRVMSFNIRYGTANDGRNHWSQRQDLVADTVDRHQPHVLGVQEALAFQLRFLEDAFPHHRRIGVGVVNQKHPRVETVDEVEAKIRRAVDLFGAERVLLNPDCGFATFADNPITAAEVAEGKLAAMAEASQRVRGG